MWAHAEDLETLEFTLMQVASYIAGPVRRHYCNFCRGVSRVAHTSALI
jgi:hypothetical protein